MGLLTQGTPLNCEDTKKWTNHVKRNGIEQFINLHSIEKDREGDELKWGDELEYLIVRFDHEAKRAFLSLKGHELVDILRQFEDNNNNPPTSAGLWRPEYGTYSIEGSPAVPYGALLTELNNVECSLESRRKEVQHFLLPCERILSLTSFPRLGCPGFTYPEFKVDPQTTVTNSRFFPDEAILPNHPKFVTMTRNITSRRGSKINVQIPIFVDENTPRPFIESDIPEQKPDMIYLDSTGFGLGCGCLQATFQSFNIEEAKKLYDNFVPLAPILLALTAGTPFYRGYISDVDCRWNVLSAALDDRCPAELKAIPKSRYDSVDMYLCEEYEEYNDITVVYDKEHYKKLIRSGVDKNLSKHIAHLFIRDPLYMYSETMYQDNWTEFDHFESIQSSNWQSIRFKPPPAGGQIGWRVEFRTCDAQLTDFENAAFVTFLMLLSRVIVSSHISFIIPISKVDENMGKAQKRDAVLTEKFWFKDDPKNQNNNKSNSLMTMDQIINGTQEFKGLIPLVEDYLNSMDVIDTSTRYTIEKYLTLISNRAKGDVMTGAKWMRNFIISHPKYKKDSVISDEMNYDLLWRIAMLPSDPCEKLLGKNV